MNRAGLWLMLSILVGCGTVGEDVADLDAGAAAAACATPDAGAADAQTPDTSGRADLGAPRTDAAPALCLVHAGEDIALDICGPAEAKRAVCTRITNNHPTQFLGPVVGCVAKGYFCVAECL